MTSADLVQKFGLPFSGFSDPIEWTDGVGFSLIKDRYGNFASIYKIGKSNTAHETGLIPLWITVTYGKKSNDGISLGSGENGLKDPVDLDFSKDFFYDQENQKFFYHDKEISAHDILTRIENVHLKPTKIVAGFPLRTRLWFWRKFLPGCIKFLDWGLINLYYLFTGRKIPKQDLVKRYFHKKWKKETFNTRPNSDTPQTPITSFEPVKTINFFGYQAPRWSVVFYCFLQLLLYFLNVYYFKITTPSVARLFRNNFLSLCYVVVSFAITEEGIPGVLLYGIEQMPLLFIKASFIHLKVTL